MPVYNGKKFLKEAIDSVLNQTFKDFEFIIVNDCSTDDTNKILADYLNADRRIIIRNNVKNIGPAETRNTALKIAKGEYIAIMDSDDISLENRFEKQLAYLENNKEVFLVGSGAIVIDENKKVIDTYTPPNNFTVVMKTLERHNCIFHSSVFFRNTKNIYYRNKMQYCEDYDLFLRLLGDGLILTNIKEPLIKYRVNLDSVSHGSRYKQKMFTKMALNFYIQRKTFGTDNYNSFNVESYTNSITDDNYERNSLIANAKLGLRVKEPERTRLIVNEYISKYGYNYMIVLLKLASYFPKRFFKY